VPDWVMIARTGTWRGHPAGPERITTTDLQSAAAYFDRHYRANGQDLVIDYHHSSVFAAQRGMPQAPAAGWIGAMELRADGSELWGRVMWTNTGRQAVAEREYRYLSPVLLYGRPDRVSGDPVPLAIHSVALTNTPFMTELAALNADRPDLPVPGASPGQPPIGGSPMKLLALLTAALGLDPDATAKLFGLAGPEEDDAVVANAIKARFETELPAPEVRIEVKEQLPELVANALGVQPDAEPLDVQGAILRLQAGPMPAICGALGIDAASELDAVLNSITGLQVDHRTNEAEALVDGAVAAGKVPPAQRDFWLNAAQSDIEAARVAINGLAVATAPAPQIGVVNPARVLDEADRKVCRLFGVTEEAYLANRK